MPKHTMHGDRYDWMTDREIQMMDEAERAYALARLKSEADAEARAPKRGEDFVQRVICAGGNPALIDQE